MSDPVLDAYGEWLNDALYAAKLGDGETLMWLGENRWVLLSPEGPEAFLIEIKFADVVPRADGD